MCGIAGYVSNCEQQAAVLMDMSAAVNHRGPDDSGLWEEAGIGLAHRRLSIIDLSSYGHQPMVSSCDRYVIVFNGEIYNYLELREELRALGEIFEGHSDTEVLLAAYRRWGEDCLRRLNGMWAFAIWDKKERSLFCSRDRFGKKPFYYTASRDGFFFASEVKALLAAKVVKPEVNLTSLADFAAERVSDHTRQTMFKNVEQLRPGEWMKLCNKKMIKGAYWSLEDDVKRKLGDLKVTDIQELLADAVKIRLRADTDVGVLLSGGLDSSAVTCLAASNRDSQIHAFCTVDTPPVDEAEGIHHVAAMYPNVVVHQDKMSAQNFYEELNRCIWHQEEPFADGSMVAHFRLMKIASASGVKVLLTGQGADEIFAGYPGYLAIQLAGYLKSFQLAEFMNSYRAMRRVGEPLSLKSVAGYCLPLSMSGKLRYRRSRNSVDWLIPECREISVPVGSGLSFGRGEDALDRALRDAIQNRTLPGFLHYEDRNSMAHGVETRLPFLDYRLVTAVLASGSKVKTQGGVTKAQLRDAMADVVPAKIVRRTAKTGYPAPLAKWLRTANAGLWDEWVSQVRNCPLVERVVWERYLKGFLGGNDANLPAVWRGLVIGLWYGQFIEGKV